MNSNATDIRNLLNPQGKALIETTIYPRTQFDQELIILLLLGEVPILIAIYLILKKKKASKIA
jgi:hypothetical protein